MVSGKDWPKVHELEPVFWVKFHADIEKNSFPTAAGELRAVFQTIIQGTCWYWMCFLMLGPLTTYWKVSEIPVCLKKKWEDAGYCDLSQFLPGLAAGEKSRTTIGGQWCLRQKMQYGFLHQTKPLAVAFTSCFSSLPLLSWLFGLLLLEWLSFLGPGKGANAEVQEMP